MSADIAQLRRLLAKATDGPWSFANGVLVRVYSLAPEHYQEVARRNAALIAAMRNALPDLLALAERHDARVTELIEANNRDVERRREAERAYAAQAEEIARLRAALEPFAKFADRFGDTARDDSWNLTRNPSGKGDLTMGDVRRARAALRSAAQPAAERAPCCGLCGAEKPGANRLLCEECCMPTTPPAAAVEPGAAGGDA